MFLDIEEPSKVVGEFDVNPKTIQNFQVKSDNDFINDEGWIEDDLLYKPFDSPNPTIGLYNVKIELKKFIYSFIFIYLFLFIFIYFYLFLFIFIYFYLFLFIFIYFYI